MIKLCFYKAEDFEDLTSYDLDEIQSRFTAMPKATLEIIKEKNAGDKFPVSILYQNKAVGFFVLDFGVDKFDLTENENSTLLRSLSINPDYQGKGIGKIAMIALLDFVKDHFPECNEVVLAVNFDNKSAYELYLKCGFEDQGKSREMSKGFQHLLNKKIE
ncbi:GNAT family N-acetyltransferase [Epilithonimonas sp. JDS]|uniref:GNAT family N-acetyltransferase n=1 Tax=Epilithonimonas sp. JDS TaxID=2902797 RepID=UPI001E3D4113|nr:GNAT family N-acetyltransferase [Epilithonimonas sp. JDS]MCD9856130.1 GNAT family N-acetyltransferase [Epilithonimonas sp. JDS]